jgi:Na+/H+ antiporter NhaD/arsenite permease-like protein
VGGPDFLSVLAPFVLVVLVLLCRIMFRAAFRYDAARIARVMALNERDAIRDPRLVAVSRAVLGAVLVAFGLHAVLHLEPSAPTWAATPPQSGRPRTSWCSASPNAPGIASRSGASPSTG